MKIFQFRQRLLVDFLKDLVKDLKQKTDNYDCNTKNRNTEIK